MDIGSSPNAVADGRERVDLPRSGYRPEIDGLRAIAVLAVMVFHSSLTLFPGGYLGVDIFFVISGFLITKVLLNEMSQGSFSLKEFFYRRIRRIMPALWFVMAICLAAGLLILLPGSMLMLVESSIATTLFGSNFYFWQQSGYFDTSSYLKPLLHTWSLAVEEQYYVVYPLLLLAAFRLTSRKTLIGLFVLATMASFMLAIVASNFSPTWSFFLLPTRVWEFSIGGLAAFYALSQSGRLEILRERDWIGKAGLLAIFLALMFFDEHQVGLSHPGWFTLVPVIGTFAVLISGADTSSSRFLCSKPLVFIGTMSYSAYLWHQPIFAFAAHLTRQEPDVGFSIVLLSLSLGAAYLTYKFVEQPFRDRDRFSRRQTFQLALIISPAFLIFGMLGLHTQGFADRFNVAFQGDVGQEIFHQYLEDNFLPCENANIEESSEKFGKYNRCKQSLPGALDVALLGDSHAEHLFIGLAEERRDLNVGYLIRAGVPSPEKDSFAEIFDFLGDPSTPSLDLLIAVYLANPGYEITETRRELAATVAFALSHGHRVILLGDTPSFDISPEYCLYAQGSEQDQACLISRSSFDEVANSYHSILEEIRAETSVDLVELSGHLCDEKHCSMTIGGDILFRDENHLNILGSKFIGQAVAMTLTELESTSKEAVTAVAND